MFCSPHISLSLSLTSTGSQHSNSDTEWGSEAPGDFQQILEAVYDCLIEQATIICSFLLRAIKHSYYPEFSSSPGKNILKQY